MDNIDWTQFAKRISINAPAEKILSMWASQETLEQWFLSEARFFSFDGDAKNRSKLIAVGDTYKWMWYGSDNVAEGRVLSVNDKGISFTFLGCNVRVAVSEESGENMLELVQFDIPTDEETKKSTYVGCTRGWTFYMTNLKSILEGGIDLRNRNGDLVNVINT